MHVTRFVAKPALTALFALAGLAVAGCGGAPPPVQDQTEATAAIRAAEEVGAAQAPQAALHLELAREHMHVAEALIDQGKMEDASRVLMRAKADAELAMALAREAQAQEQAQQTRGTIESLQRGLR